ncbi:MAG: nucleoside monophosphate kinase [Patescibacteria group bacterium]|nr:nucleoside monophosphate kinase [Patescibacteria group bacterium]
MKKIAVVLHGPPGSGKGTQADLLADRLNLIHFDTGKLMEGVVHDPKRQKEKLIRRERQLFDSGKLLTPSFVLREAEKDAKRIRKADWGIVLSGSPRTLYEAQGLLPVLEELYGKKNVYIFKLEAPADFSMKRNSSRLKCKMCGYNLLTAFYPGKHPKHCPVCGGPFYRRSLDRADIIKVRLREYEERTMPIFDFEKKRGYKVHAVDARPAPYKVLEHILKRLPE